MESNKEVARQWLEAVGNGDEATFRSVSTDDCVHQVMGTSVLSGERNLDEVAELAMALHRATKDGLRFEFLSFTAEDDRVAVEFEGFSDLQTGGTYNNVYHLLFHFRDGKVCRVREYADTKIVDEAVGPILAAQAQ
jgi:uncharacterized protein